MPLLYKRKRSSDVWRLHLKIPHVLIQKYTSKFTEFTLNHTYKQSVGTERYHMILWYK